MSSAIIGWPRRLVRSALSLRGRVGPTGTGSMVVGAVLLIVVVGPLIASSDPNAIGTDALAAPSSAHWMGTDEFGRDVLSRWLHGGRTSLAISLGAVALAALLGTLAGVVAGYKEGSWIDAVIMRLVDTLLSIPLIVLVIAIAGLFSAGGLDIGIVVLPGYIVLILVLGVAFSPVFARIARATSLAEMEEDYISAARGLGAGPGRLIFANVLPNITSPLLVQGSFLVAVGIGAEATVSFLGFGVQPPDSSWGNLLHGAQQYIYAGAWWLLWFPIGAIIVAVFGFNLLGDGLRDALDPRHTGERL